MFVARIQNVYIVSCCVGNDASFLVPVLPRPRCGKTSGKLENRKASAVAVYQLFV